MLDGDVKCVALSLTVKFGATQGCERTKYWVAKFTYALR